MTESKIVSELNEIFRDLFDDDSIPQRTGAFRDEITLCSAAPDQISTPSTCLARIPTMKDTTATVMLMTAISRKRDLKGSSWATDV